MQSERGVRSRDAGFPGIRVWRFFEQAGEVEIIPADEPVFIVPPLHFRTDTNPNPENLGC